MRSEDGVDQCGLPESCLACCNLDLAFVSMEAAYRMRTDANDVKLEPALEQLSFNLLGYAVEANMAFGHHGCPRWRDCGRHYEIWYSILLSNVFSRDCTRTRGDVVGWRRRSRSWPVFSKGVLPP